MENYTYEVGQKAVIIDNIGGHRFDIGEVVTILERDIDGGGVFYEAKGKNEQTWYIEEVEVKPYVMAKAPYPATLICDFYKTSHLQQYPEGTEVIYSTWTPRSNRYFPKADKVVSFGIQSFVIKYLINFFNDNFFSRPLDEVLYEYTRVIKHTLGTESPSTSHIEALHKLGYLPIEVKALKEGTLAPIKTPMVTIENTLSEFFWLTNYLETIMSNEIWLPMTSATIAHTYRQLLNRYSIKTTGSIAGVEYQGHDFSMRGMGSFDSSKASGAAHLLSFFGTDTIPAILYLEEFYKANIENETVGTSIPATEHSVMCSYGQVNEFDLFKRLITEVYPNGFFSVVSDTWDFWQVVGEYLPKLKDEILARDGRVVIRPDSGNPVLILIGDKDGKTELERKGLIEALWDIFGGTINELGYKVLDPHIGAIYGDSITLERAEEILEGLAEKGFASSNVVLGIGSYSYQYNTRDTFGFAMKATYAKVNGEERMLFKDPKTDDGTKKSQRGRVIVYKDNGEIKFMDGLLKEETLSKLSTGEPYTDLLETVFLNGKLKREQSLSEIREILNNN